MIKFVFFTISSIIGLPLLVLFLFTFQTIHSEDFINDRLKEKVANCSTLDDEEQDDLGRTQKDRCLDDIYAPAGYFLIYLMGIVGFIFSIPFFIFILKRLYRLFKIIIN